MPLVVIPEARQIAERRRADAAEEDARRERRQAIGVGVTMLGALAFQLLTLGLSWRLTGDAAVALYRVSVLSAPLPLLAVVIWRSRTD